MKTVREVLNTVKEIKGIKNDTELAKRIGVPVDTMRSWIQNDSVRKPLLEYCFNNQISIDEVFFGEHVFVKERCENCNKRSSCSVYRQTKLTPVIIEEIMGGIHIIVNPHGKDHFTCRFYNDGELLNNISVNAKGVRKIFIEVK